MYYFDITPLLDLFKNILDFVKVLIHMDNLDHLIRMLEIKTFGLVLEFEMSFQQ